MNQLSSQFFSFFRILRERLQEKDSPKNTIICSPLQIKTLALVDEQTDRTMRSVADALFITSPSATAVISKLVDIGQLTRHPDTKDRRIVRLRITPKGKLQLKNGQEQMNERMKELFSVVSPKDQKEFVRILKDVIHLNK